MDCNLRNFAPVASFAAMVAAAGPLCGQAGQAPQDATRLAVSSPAVPLGSAGSSAPTPAPQAPALFASVIAALDARQSIAARVRHRVDIFDHQLVGSGIYLQQALAAGASRGSDRLMRYDLKIQIEDQATSLLQICDGNSLWIHQDILGQVSLSQVNLLRVRAALNSQEWPGVAPGLAWIMLGGLPKLMKNLGDWYQFTSVEEGRLERFPVWVLRGKLLDLRAAALLPEQREQILAGQPPDLERLAKHLPDRVVLMVGRDDLFPYRLEYWRLLPGEKKPLSLRKPPPVDRMLLAMELFEVQFDVPLDPRQFVYNPGELQKVDQTPMFLQLLGLKEAAEPSAPARARK